MVKIKKKKDERPRCEKCNSTLVYRRISSKELVCRTCGFIKQLEEKK